MHINVPALTALPLILAGILIAPPAAHAWQVTAENNVITLRTGTQTVFDYCYQATPFKPYVRQLATPAGVNVLRDQVADHIHHHGLMFALSVDGTDFWSELKTCGKEVYSTDGAPIVHVAEPGKPLGADFSQTLDWTAPDKTILLRETRSIALTQSAPGGSVQPNACTMLTWRSQLETPPGKATSTLSGAHYVGLGMRFLACMDGVGTFFNASEAPGDIVRGEERNFQANWCAYTAPVDGKPVTVAIFSHPDNPRHPTTWFTMPKPFAYMSATLNVHKEPLTIEAGKPLDLRYGVALWDGAIPKAEVDKEYGRWAAAKK